MKNLISAADIKAQTAASLGVEAHKLEITIPEAQQRHLRPLVGAALLAQLLALVATMPEQPATVGVAQAQATSEAAAYALALASWRADQAGPLLTLLDQVKPALCQWALVEAWPNLLVHVENAGVVLKTGNQQGTSTADLATLNQVYTAHRETAIWRGQELVSWLESNKSDYPSYQSTTPTATGRQPMSDFGGISL